MKKIASLYYYLRCTNKVVVQWMLLQCFVLILLVNNCKSVHINTLDILEVNVDLFGYSVSTSGDTIVVGAQYEDSNATGVNGDQNNNDAQNSGAAYVFVREGNGTTWAQQAYLKASNTGVEDLFGCSVSISGDTIVVGANQEDSNATGVNGDQSKNDAYRSGAAYVFVRDGTIWTQQAYLKASNTEELDEFGISVSISGDTIVVGAQYEDSNATGVNGDQNNNDAQNSGAAYVFVRVGTVWTQQAYLKASNTAFSRVFGFSVSISGDTIVVGAYQENSNTTGVNGDQNNNNASESGAAYVFVREGTTWTQQAYLKASNTDAGDYFAFSVSISGDTIVVGAHKEDSNATGVNGDQNNNNATESGAAYVFVREGTTWTQQAYLKASNTEGGDWFGIAVSISGDTIVVGADIEGSNATGVNGDQDNNGATYSGAAYVFVRNGTTWTQQAYLKAARVQEFGLFGRAVAADEYIVVSSSGSATVFDGVIATTTGTTGTSGTTGTTGTTGVIGITTGTTGTAGTSGTTGTTGVIGITTGTTEPASTTGTTGTADEIEESGRCCMLL
jgi:hypothetical protein